MLKFGQRGGIARQLLHCGERQGGRSGEAIEGGWRGAEKLRAGLVGGGSGVCL